MLARLSILVAALSLAVSAAACAVWVRSYWASQYLGRSHAAGWVGGLSMSGILRIERGLYAGDAPGWYYETAPPDSLRHEVEARDRTGGRLLQRLGFAFARIDYGNGQRRYAVYLPHWSVALVFGVPPARWLRAARKRRRRRLNAGRCRRCGYDLRATPDRCPECGDAARGPKFAPTSDAAVPA